MAAKVITLEEHFWIPELRVVPIGGAKTRWSDGLDDLGAMRLHDMDEAGIDIQVISHAPAGAQNHPPAESVALSRRANDVLHGAIRAHPDRFAGFALLPTPDPAAAADELDRAVSELGFKGAMIHGLTHGAFIDEPQFAPIFSRAAKLACRSICIRPCRMPPWSKPTTRTIRRCCRLPGALPPRPARWRCGWCCRACSTGIPS
jgi:predicted TIM-barrel fold metal-dependent hydrolase